MSKKRKDKIILIGEVLFDPLFIMFIRNWTYFFKAFNYLPKGMANSVLKSVIHSVLYVLNSSGCCFTIGCRTNTLFLGSCRTEKRK